MGFALIFAHKLVIKTLESYFFANFCALSEISNRHEYNLHKNSHYQKDHSLIGAFSFIFYMLLKFKVKVKWSTKSTKQQINRETNRQAVGCETTKTVIKKVKWNIIYFPFVCTPCNAAAHTAFKSWRGYSNYHRTALNVWR